MMSSSDSKTHVTKLSKNKKEKKDLPTELTHVKINKCQNKQTKANSLSYSSASSSHARWLPTDTTFLEKILMTEPIYQYTYFKE